MNITKTAMITVCGRPNVGKSSLTNALVGEKVAIVSNKAQTTRNRIYGIVNREDTQYILLDTPGLHKPKSALGDYMVKVVTSSLSDVDCALLLVEPIPHVGGPEKALIDRIREALPDLEIPPVSMQEDIPRYVPKNAADLRYFLHPGDIESVPRETIVGSGLDKDPVTYNDVFTYNLGYYRVENPDAPEAASVLILKDSFQNATIDYLSAIFRSVTVVDPRSYQETPDLASLLDADGIDLVLFFYHQNNVSRELIDFLSA